MTIQLRACPVEPGAAITHVPNANARNEKGDRQFPYGTEGFSRCTGDLDLAET
jgi:hypothetical protein